MPRIVQGIPSVLGRVSLTAIVFLVAGSVSLRFGYKARLGAALLLVFLALATYDFHDFWTLNDPKAQQEQMIPFLKNAALMGALLLILANGTGPFGLEARPRSATTTTLIQEGVTS